jgi:hypothetical protein
MVCGPSARGHRPRLAGGAYICDCRLVGRFFVLAIVLFAAAAVLAWTTPSSWPLLLARIALLVVGIVALVIGLRLRRKAAG